ncbi:MAG: ABC transporter substrate-binding protein [Lachnospiraceae bacterium]|nr:ABC transporter substrate-binding protein [Lachnospiraceae bacterium]
MKKVLGIFACIVLLSGCATEKTDNLRVGAMKGPTSIGILPMMQEDANDNYEFHMATAADELVPMMAKGELDVALVPANVAAILFQKTQAAVKVIDINTLGVLYFVSGNDKIQSIEDLRDTTIYMTGKGTTPEATVRYVLHAAGLKEEDYTLEFKSEPTEVAAILAQDFNAVALLPQPFVTVALSKNENLKIRMDLNELWQTVSPEHQSMVTGVTVVRAEVLEKHPKAVERFLADHETSVTNLVNDLEKNAMYAVEAGILPNQELAMKAIPLCNIVCITGQEMQEALSGYLEVLAEFDAQLVGGAMPGDEFYYTEIK